MDDKHIDELISRACHSRLDAEIPPEEFFEALATRFPTRRHRRLLTPFRIAASVGLLLAGAASLLFLKQSHDPAPTSALSHNSIYLESVSNVQDRIERSSETHDRLRASIDREFPFFQTTPQ